METKMKNMNKKQYFAVALGLLALLVTVTALCMGCSTEEQGDRGSLEDTTVSVPPSEESNETQDRDHTSPDGEPTQSETSEEEDRDPTDESRPEESRSEESCPDESLPDAETDGEADTPADTEEDTKTPAVSPTYEEYCAMTSAEQEAFFFSFADHEDFFLWFEAAKADYEERHPGVEIGPDGIIPPEG
jgi:hypothetical protein